MTTIAMPRETFGEYLFRLLAKVAPVCAVCFSAFVWCIAQIGDWEIAKLEQKYKVTTETFVKTERIPVKQQIDNYIDSLPIPENTDNFTSIYEEEILIARAKAEEEAKLMEEAMAKNSELAIKVVGITPKIRVLNTSSYCPCEKCCNKTDGITASGEKAKAWYTVAAGQGYKMGTIIYIPSLSDKPNGGWFMVQDRGGAISSEKLDIYLNSHSEALQYGRRTQECYIYEF